MRNHGILLIIALIVMAAILYWLRYEITVHSPIIVKLNRLTGQTWVANSGVWMDIKHGVEK